MNSSSRLVLSSLAIVLSSLALAACGSEAGVSEPVEVRDGGGAADNGQPTPDAAPADAPPPPPDAAPPADAAADVPPPPVDAAPVDAAPADTTPPPPPDAAPQCPGRTMCTGGCCDLQSDINNCGACGNRCAAGQVCSAGACIVSCAPGLTNCSGACRDTQTDPSNCGACGHVCPAGNSCAANNCVAPPPPPPSCTRTLCGGACCDLQTDVANCGACGRACPTGNSCNAGVCVAPTPPPPVMDEWTLDYGSSPGDQVETIRSYEFWQGIEPCSLSRLDGAQVGPLTSTSRCGAFRFPPGVTLRFNAEFTFPPAPGTILTRTTWSCNIATRGGSFQVYGRAPIARRNGVVVPLHQVDNGHGGCDWAP